MGSENSDDKFCSRNPSKVDHRTALKQIMLDVSILRQYKLLNEKNMCGLCWADSLWLPNSIFVFKITTLKIASFYLGDILHWFT